jgi:hypothetical protein
VAAVGRFRRRGQPFDFARGVPSPGRCPPDDLTIAQAIEAIRHAPVEVGYGFDVRGRQIFRQVGNTEEIRGFDPRDLQSIVGGTFVHNHPPYAEFTEGDPRRQAGSFSLLDLVFLYENRVGEMVVVTQERTYRLRPLAAGHFLDPGEIRDEYRIQRRRVMRELHRKVVRGIISVEESLAQGRRADEVMERLGLYFDYQRMEVSDDAS